VTQSERKDERFRPPVLKVRVSVQGEQSNINSIKHLFAGFLEDLGMVILRAHFITFCPFSLLLFIELSWFRFGKDVVFN